MDLFGGPPTGWMVSHSDLRRGWDRWDDPKGTMSSNCTSKATDGPKLSVLSFADLCLLPLFQQAA